MFAEQLAALQLATPTSSPTRATTRRHTCPTDDVDDHNLSLDLSTPHTELVEPNRRAQSLTSESLSEASLSQQFETRIKTMTQSVCANEKDAGRFLSLLERMVDLADQSRQAHPLEANSASQTYVEVAPSPTLENRASDRPSCMHRPHTMDTYWPRMQDDSQDVLHGALEPASFTNSFTSAYPLIKSNSSTDLTTDMSTTSQGYYKNSAQARNALGLSGMGEPHMSSSGDVQKYQVRSRATLRPLKPLRVNEFASTGTEDWQQWQQPRQRVGASHELLATSQYRTLNDVRQDRKLKTKRSLAAIGRIPLKVYLEIGDDIAYRSVRRLARTVYAEWLQPNVRLAKQDTDRLQACFHRLEYEFPILGDCDKHWKARELMLQVIDNAIDETALRRRKALTLSPLALSQDALLHTPLSSPSKRFREEDIDSVRAPADSEQDAQSSRRRLVLCDVQDMYTMNAWPQSPSPEVDDAVAYTDSQGPVTPVDITKYEEALPVMISQGVTWKFGLLDEEPMTVFSPPSHYDDVLHTKDASTAWDGDFISHLW